jgi:hypothetical protein
MGVRMTPHTLGSEHLVEGGGVLGVSVMDQELGRLLFVLEREGEVPPLLGNPG